MNSAVVAAIIAAGVSALTLVVSVAAQIYGIRRTSRDTEKGREEQHEQLDRTLTEQRTQTMNERFATAADRLGDDKPAAVRLAGVYAMAGLADDWEKNRQTCVDVLCAYLRLPYHPDAGDDDAGDDDPGGDARAKERLKFCEIREVRHTAMRVIAEHLRDKGVEKQVAARSWQGLNFNFSGVIFDGSTFSHARFSGPGSVDFGRAKFSTSDKVSFHHVDFSGGTIKFRHTRFIDGPVEFHDAKFSGGAVSFHDARFSGGTVDFGRAVFSDGRVSFNDAKFSSGVVSFDGAEFSGGVVSFEGAEFCGGVVTFRGAIFSGGTVDFSHVADWSRPPKFDWEGTPPVGVTLPAA